MGRRNVKKPTYDGNACLLYDFMVFQNLTEEDVAERIEALVLEYRKAEKEERGLEYLPIDFLNISTWIQRPDSIPRYYMPYLCMVLNAPLESFFTRSKILNGQSFSPNGLFGRVKEKPIGEISTDDLIREIKKRGYKVFKEV